MNIQAEITKRVRQVRGRPFLCWIFSDVEEIPAVLEEFEDLYGAAGGLLVFVRDFSDIPRDSILIELATKPSHIGGLFEKGEWVISLGQKKS